MSAVEQTQPVVVSAREAEVLALLGAHLSNAQIAGRLHMSVRTVEGHVSSLLRKYGVGGRRALADLAGTASQGPPAPGRILGLPAARTSFVGRSAERDLVLAALEQGRLVTMTGSGGAGKTRLAAVVAGAAASLFPSGGAFVDLVPVEGESLLQAVASALEVAERPPQPLRETVAERLGRGRCLVVLDNCEHLLEAVTTWVEQILAACPDLVVLATSRERLGLSDEQTVPIGPLPLASDAEQLFRERALAADPHHAADPAVITDLCGRLDGLPLAIELAAARSASLGATGLLTGLGDYLRLLAGGRGAAVRHRSLRAVIDWSHELLDEEERALLRRLAVFTGGFTLDAAVEVTAAGDHAAVADVLGRLVDKSLVSRRPAAGRWHLLETIRAFAAEQLDISGERPGTRRRHLHWAASAAASLEASLDGDRWRDDLDDVSGDLQAALDGADRADENAHRLARSLARLTYARHFPGRALELFRLAAALAPTPGQAALDLCGAADTSHVVTASTGEAFELLLAAAERYRLAGDGDGRAVCLARAVETACRYPAGLPEPIPPARLARLLADATAAGDPAVPRVAAHLAAAAAWVPTGDQPGPDPARARAALEAAHRTADPVLVGAALDAVCTAAKNAGRLREAHRHSLQRLALLESMDHHDPRATAEIEDAFLAASTLAIAVGDLPAALTTARRAAGSALIGEAPFITANQLIPVLVLTGGFDQAQHHAEALWNWWRQSGRPAAGRTWPAFAMSMLLHGLRGDREEQRRWHRRTCEAVGPHNAHWLGESSLTAFIDLRLAVHHHDTAAAPRLVDRIFADSGGVSHLVYTRALAAELAVIAALPAADDHLAAVEADAGENDWALACLARARGRLHEDPRQVTASVEGWERIGARFERAQTLLLLPGRTAEGLAELAALSASPVRTGAALVFG
ncbi:hypothetical protein Pve01_20140 [Planomonospora venezuelensis]|nr:LuxR C-terminal-related transcriptional regulator [Planomonospora venezuelensis]GIN00356.1 hypothetical protein Pve01_20140 [Planomonospora venezuelensis]